MGGSAVPTIRQRAKRDRFIILVLVWIHLFVLCGYTWFSLVPEWVCSFPYALIWQFIHPVGPVLATQAVCQFRNVALMWLAAFLYLVLSIVHVVFLVVVGINVWFPCAGLCTISFPWFMVAFWIVFGLMVWEALIAFLIWRLRCFLLNYSNPCGRVSLKSLDCPPEVVTRVGAGGAVAFTNSEIGSLIGEDASVENYLRSGHFARKSDKLEIMGEGVFFEDESAHMKRPNNSEKVGGTNFAVLPRDRSEIGPLDRAMMRYMNRASGTPRRHIFHP